MLYLNKKKYFFKQIKPNYIKKIKKYVKKYLIK